MLNTLFNALAYNPPGAEEGYLFWAAWGDHAGATMFGAQDAHGPIRRGVVLITCPQLDDAASGIVAGNPQPRACSPRLLQPGARAPGLPAEPRAAESDADRGARR